MQLNFYVRICETTHVLLYELHVVDDVQFITKVIVISAIY